MSRGKVSPDRSFVSTMAIYWVCVGRQFGAGAIIYLRNTANSCFGLSRDHNRLDNPCASRAQQSGADFHSAAQHVPALMPAHLHRDFYLA
jgi:hypothetical protein